MRVNKKPTKTLPGVKNALSNLQQEADRIKRLLTRIITIITLMFVFIGQAAVDLQFNVYAGLTRDDKATHGPK